MTRWHETIQLADLWSAYGDNEISFEQAQAQALKRIKESRWFRQSAELRGLVEEYLEVAEDIFEWDDAWHSVLAIADQDRVWLETYLPARTSGTSLTG